MEFLSSFRESVIKSMLTASPSLKNFYFLSQILLYITQSQDSHSNCVNKYQFAGLYDYVVIGAGTAGCVMASRLSEDENVTVLLIEAGPTEDVYSDIPKTSFYLLDTPIDWEFVSESQHKSGFGLKDRRIKYGRGKILGGSSVTNFLVYNRGNPRDYDKWKSDGAEGWGWADLFPYFIKAEDNDDPYMVASGYHGKGGPLPVSNQVYWERISEAFRDSGPYLNYSIGDSKGPTQSVFEIHQRNTRKGERYSAARAYLEPVVKNRTNLHIFTNVMVHRILFDENKKVSGVEYTRLGKKKKVRLERDLILSAGAIMSPQILMMSGNYALVLFSLCHCIVI